MTSTVYTSVVGSKWNANGTVRTFPGNTMLLWIPSDCDLHAVATIVAHSAQRLSMSGRFGFLPPDTYHMTVLGLLNHEDRNRNDWSTRVALDAPMEDADEAMYEAAKKVEWPGDISMSVTELSAVGNLTIRLQPSDVKSQQRLRLYRNALSAATGVRRADHGRYRFHVSLAYRLSELIPRDTRILQRFVESANGLLHQAGPVTLSDPQFCVFDDMSRYLPWSDRHQLGTRDYA